MSSEDRETRMKQKQAAEATVEARKAKLTEAGVDEKKMSRDPKLRQAVARLKKADSRLHAIDALDALNKAVAERKAQPKPAVDKKAKKKKAADDQSKPKKAKGKKS